MCALQGQTVSTVDAIWQLRLTKLQAQMDFQLWRRSSSASLVHCLMHAHIRFAITPGRCTWLTLRRSVFSRSCVRCTPCSPAPSRSDCFACRTWHGLPGHTMHALLEETAASMSPPLLCTSPLARADPMAGTYLPIRCRRTNAIVGFGCDEDDSPLSDEPDHEPAGARLS